jgi:hypothetical protein
MDDVLAAIRVGDSEEDECVPVEWDEEEDPDAKTALESAAKFLAWLKVASESDESSGEIC